MIITVHSNSHISLSYLPFLISTMQISWAYTGFLGILLWFIWMYLKRELESVSEWLAESRLSLHLGKTESILFGSNKRLAKCKELNITCNGIDIGSGSEVTYLGVTLDQNLSGSSMITKIISKCNNKITFLYRNANNLDKQTKMLLTSALIQCHFDYGSSMWYTGTTCRMKKKLQILKTRSFG